MRGNAICERMIGTLRRELLDRLLIVNEHHLRRVLTEYLQHYNAARPHRALGQLTPAQAGTQPPEPIDLADHRIRRKQVLRGLTHEYYVAALPPHAATERRRSLTRIVFPSPTGGYEQGQPAAWREHACEEPAGDVRHTPVRRAFRHPM
jgi:Integrase core domain